MGFEPTFLAGPKRVGGIECWYGGGAEDFIIIADGRLTGFKRVRL